MLTLQRVLRTRDVVFLPSEHSMEEVYPERQRLREIATVLNILENLEEPEQLIGESHVSEIIPSQENVNETEDAHEAESVDEAESQLMNEMAGHRESQKEVTESTEWLPTPEDTPEPSYLLDGNREIVESSQESGSMPRGWQTLMPEAEAPDRRSNNAPRREDISSQIDEANVLTSRRQRRPLGSYYTAFALAVNPSESQKLMGEAPRTRLHRDRLPAPPQQWRDLEKHLHGQEFREAAYAEFASC
ncbi:uncharacterized protein EKO05_0005332 [Ascochyta rabiei]|uniref:uncharacterized protein n=1 Tax=Didymella rabiei TaxID=5454 RepID=UPI0021F9B159|nr:uncharacterized protein EKO05_0005332 [Ascochyta rabiei]UPX14861.1 hypothetical protein EKO05_0005332 [Ascochyta rabiei]